MRIPNPPTGPYENERQALAEPMPRELSHLHHMNQIRSGDPDRVARDAVLRHLHAACDESGVDLGAYDMRVLDWLAAVENATAQVVIGLIRRAYAAGRAVPDTEQ